jgi:hypothetical protein
MAFPALIRIDGSEKIVIDRPSIVVGRSRKRADFQIDDPTVSSVHCELKTDPSGLTIRDLSRHGTLVNGRKVDSAKLHEGDIVEIVGFRFHVVFDGAASPTRTVPASDEWFVRMVGIELGPMPFDELAGMAQRGELQPEDQVRAVTGTQWQPARTIDRLFDAGEVGSAEETDSVGSASTPAAIDDDAHREGDSEEALLDGINFDQFAEEEVSALTDEAATKPTFRLDDSSRNPRDPMGDTILPTQGGTLTDASVFRDAVATVDELADGHSEDRPGDVAPIDKSRRSQPEVTVDVEKLPGTGWFYRHDGYEFGPVDLDGLAELAQVELLLPEDTVRLPGSSVWVRAREVPGVFSTGSEGSSFSDESTYDDSSFDDLDSESAPPAGIHTDSSRSPRPDEEMPATLPPPSPQLQSAPRPVERTRWLEKIAAPVVSGAVYLRAHPGVSGGILAAAIAVWLMLPGTDHHEAYVSGEIQLDGSPLKDATITFVEPNSGWGASANLDENGRFEIATLRGGLKPGNYNVSLMPTGIEAEFVMQELQRQYRKQRVFEGTEPATFETGTPDEVASRKTDDEDVVALPPGTIPIQFRSSETSGLHARIDAGSNKVNFRLASK